MSANSLPRPPSDSAVSQAGASLDDAPFAAAMAAPFATPLASLIALGADQTRVQTVGAKAASLGRLMGLRDGRGFLVPDGWVIPVEWYDRHLVAAWADSHALSAEDAADRLRRQPMDPAMVAVLKARWLAQEAPGPVAVRSSGIDEDGARHSFAGQFLSVLDVDSLTAMVEAVRSVWASAWSPAAISYARARGILPRGMAVIVQRQVDARWSGVLFTRDPRAGQPSGQALVEAVAGLGEGLVSGRDDPWRWRIGADGTTMLEAAPGMPAASATQPETTEATEATEASEATAATAAIGPASLTALHAAGQHLEKAWALALDIEWSIDTQGRLWLLQARPITVGERDEGLDHWSNANVAENFPDPLSPFLMSIVRRGYAAYFRNLGLGLGMAPERIARMAPWLEHLVGRHGGRLYYNLTNIHAVLSQAPAGRRLAAWFNTFTGASEFPEVPTPAIGRLARAIEWLRMGATTALRYRRIDPNLRRFEATVDRYAGCTTREALASADPAALADRLGEFLDIRTRRWNDAAMADAAAMISYGLLGRRTASAPLSSRPGLQHDLLKGLPGLVSARPVEVLWALAQQVEADPALRAHFAASEPEALARDWQAGALGDFGQRFTDYLRDWGFRYSRELMLDSPTPDEDPVPMFRLLKSYLRNIGADPHSVAQAQQTERLRATDEARALLAPNPIGRHLPFTAAWRFDRLLQATQDAIRYRERARMKQALLYTRLRKVARAAGERLHAAGWLDRVDDVFLVEPEMLIDRLHRLAQGQRDADPAWRREIATARLMERLQNADNPPDSFSLPRGLCWTAERMRRGSGPGSASGLGLGSGSASAPPSAIPSVEPSAIDGDLLRLTGTAACGGRVQGQAIVVTDVARIDTIERGQILVTRQTDPGWAAVFFLVDGLIIERGGMLSHGAIIAREYGIPAVIGVPLVTQRIQSGQTVIVDGDAGAIHVVH